MALSEPVPAPALVAVVAVDDPPKIDSRYTCVFYYFNTISGMS